MATNICGKWKQYFCENFDDYLKAIGCSDEELKKASPAKCTSGDAAPVEEFIYENDRLTRSYIVSGECWKKDTYEFDKELDDIDVDEKTKIKIKFTVEGEKLVETVSSPYKSKTEYQVTDGELISVSTVEGNPVKAVRKFKRL